MSLTVDITWPVTIPLPSIDYAGTPRYATIVSPPEASYIVARSRFQRSYSLLTVAWMLTDAQLAIFKTFFETDLGMGTACFKIELRYPELSVLTEWMVRFQEGYDSVSQEGMWSIQSSLELVNPVELPNLAAE